MRGRTSPAGPPSGYVRDPGPQEIAAVQAQARGWLVCWSTWRRTWTAFARFGAAPVILDDADSARLLLRCLSIEQEAAAERTGFA